MHTQRYKFYPRGLCPLNPRGLHLTCLLGIQPYEKVKILCHYNVIMRSHENDYLCPKQTTLDMSKSTRAFSILASVVLGASSLQAQFAGTSYLGAGGGTSIPHTSSRFSTPEFMLSLSYGYLISDRLYIDAPLVYQGLTNGQLKGSSYSTIPTIYYGISKGDKYRFDIGGSLGIGFEQYARPKDPLIEVKGSLESVSLYIGAGIRYSLLLSSRIGVFGMYRYLYQPQSAENMSQTFSAGILVYL